MAWAFVQDTKGVTLAQYDRVAAEVGKDAPDGLIVHVAGEGPAGDLRIIDVWESKEAYERYRSERLTPAIMRATGGQTAPQEVEELIVHDIIRP